MRARRSLLAAGVALAVAPAAACLAPVAASADQPVVQAVVYPGGQGAQHTVTVTDAQLAACPGYSGSSPFLLYPSRIAYQPAAASSWSLDTVIECGLRIPRASLTAVNVDSATHGAEVPALVPADLFDPSRYRDSTAPTALPVISLDGAQNQVTYDRPWRGGSDANGADQVTETGAPIAIEVYENAPPLQVEIVRTALAGSGHTVRDQFTVQAIDASGHAVSPSSLHETWTFGDGSGSSAAQPTHTFPAGRWFVTVMVSDPATGTGGTRTVAVSVDGAPLSGNQDRAGAGRHRKPDSNSGSVHGSGTASQGGTVTNPATVTNPTVPPASRPTTPATPTPAAPTPAAPTPAPSTVAPSRTVSTTATTTTPPSSTAHPRAATRPRPSRPPARRVGAPAPPGTRLVSGQLVASLHPLNAGSTPLAPPAVAPPPAAAVGSAVRTSSPAGWLAALAGVVLIALGAVRERRGRGRWHRLHPPA